jgi:hypothetical protein
MDPRIGGASALVRGAGSGRRSSSAAAGALGAPRLDRGGLSMLRLLPAPKRTLRDVLKLPSMTLGPAPASPQLGHRFLDYFTFPSPLPITTVSATVAPPRTPWGYASAASPPPSPDLAEGQPVLPISSGLRSTAAPDSGDERPRALLAALADDRVVCDQTSCGKGASPLAFDRFRTRMKPLLPGPRRRMCCPCGQGCNGTLGGNRDCTAQRAPIRRLSGRHLLSRARPDRPS